MKQAKSCTKCGEQKPIDSFSMNGPKYRHSACKVCRSLARIAINDTPRGLAYTRWQCMKLRCYGGVPKNSKYYAEKGIVVCERWQKFENFLADMGFPPSPNHQLDRIDNAKSYGPENCRWATQQEQSRNRENITRVEINGQRKLLCEWAEISGISVHTLRLRFYKGWPHQDLLRAVRRRAT